MKQCCSVGKHVQIEHIVIVHVSMNLQNLILYNQNELSIKMPAEWTTRINKTNLEEASSHPNLLQTNSAYLFRHHF